MREYINNIPIITKQEFKNLVYNPKYGYVEADLPEDISLSRKFYIKNSKDLYGLEYKSGCFYPFLIFLKNEKQEIPKNRLSLGIFQ